MVKNELLKPDINNNEFIYKGKDMRLLPINNNKLNLYNLNPENWKKIEEINNNFDTINSNNFKELENQINKYQKELELLRLKLSKYENDISNEER